MEVATLGDKIGSNVVQDTEQMKEPERLFFLMA